MLFDPDRVRARANDDPEFTLAARHWNMTIRLDVGEAPYMLEIRDGRITGFVAIDSAHAARLGHDVRIAAPARDWREFLRPVPRPFFQDLFAALEREHFEFQANDPFHFMAYYPAARRLFELMRAER